MYDVCRIGSDRSREQSRNHQIQGFSEENVKPDRLTCGDRRRQPDDLVSQSRPGSKTAQYLPLGLLPLIGVSIFSYRSAESAVVAAAGTRVEELAFNAIDKLDRNLFERYGDVHAFAASAPAKSMEPARVAGWMDTMMGAYAPIYKLMVVADAQGQIVAVNGVDLDGRPLPATARLLQQDVSREPWFREAAEGRINDGAAFVEDLHHDAMMKTVYGTTTGADLAMSFTAPIKDADGKVIGVWTNRVNWDVAIKVLDDVQTRAQASGTSTVRLGLVGSNGLLLVARIPPESCGHP
jgi:hypothetical protein